MDEKRKSKPQMKWEAKKVMIRESVVTGYIPMISSEVIQLGLRLAKEARRMYTSENVGNDPTIDQLHRSLGSVPANIMEGLGRATIAFEVSFALNARGSVYEALIHSEILDFKFHEDVKVLARLTDKYVESLLDRQDEEID